MMYITHKEDNMINKSIIGRLVDEYITLKSRLVSLRKFVKQNSTFTEFTFTYKMMLRQLYFFMKMYYRILKKRLKYLHIDNNVISDYLSEEAAKNIIKKETKENKTKVKKTKKNVENKKD